MRSTQPAPASAWARSLGITRPKVRVAARLGVGDLVGARERRDQVDRRARRRDLEHPGGVGDRQRGAGGAGLEVAQVGDRGRVLGRGAGVGGRLRRGPARVGRGPSVSSRTRASTASPPASPPASASASRAPSAASRPSAPLGPLSGRLTYTVSVASPSASRAPASTAANASRRDGDDGGSDEHRAESSPHPKKTSASRYRASGTTLSSATASARATSSISVRPQRRHRPPLALVGGVDRVHAEAGREHAVVRGRGAAALDVAEDRRPGLVAGALLDLPLEPVADAAEAHVAERVGRRVPRRPASSPLRHRALGDDDDRERLARANAPLDEVADVVDVERLLGDQDHVRRRRRAPSRARSSRRGGP